MSELTIEEMQELEDQWMHCVIVTRKGASWTQVIDFFPESAVALWEKGMALKEPYPKFLMGLCYFYEKVVNLDPDLSFQLFSDSADQSLAPAQMFLGFSHQFGIGTPEDHLKAFEFFQLAAEQGEPEALSQLGFCYFNGTGVQEDKKVAVQYLEKAAEQGQFLAQYQVGRCFRDGELRKMLKKELNGFGLLLSERILRLSSNWEGVISKGMEWKSTTRSQ